MTQSTRLTSLLGYFDYEHLPAHLQVVSSSFYTQATALARDLGGVDDDQLAMALQHLLIAKDAAVRVAVAQALPLMVTHHLAGGDITHHRNASGNCGVCSREAGETPAQYAAKPFTGCAGCGEVDGTHGWGCPTERGRR